MNIRILLGTFIIVLINKLNGRFLLVNVGDPDVDDDDRHVIGDPDVDDDDRHRIGDPDVDDDYDRPRIGNPDVDDDYDRPRMGKIKIGKKSKRKEAMIT